MRAVDANVLYVGDDLDAEVGTVLHARHVQTVADRAQVGDTLLLGQRRRPYRDNNQFFQSSI